MRSPLIALCLLLPAAALAGDVEIVSRHQQNLSVKGDRKAYTRVTSSNALFFEATGPGELTLTLRQEFVSRSRVTKLVLKQDGTSVKKIELKLRAGGKYARGRKGRVTRPKTVTLHVPDGEHLYRLIVSTKRHGVAAAVSFTPEEEEEGLELMALVPLGGEDDDIPLMGLAPAPADEDDIPLMGLGTPPPDDTTGEIGLAGLTPTPEATTTPTDTTKVVLARTQPTASSATEPIETPTPMAPRAPVILAEVHGVFTQSALGAGAFGGGVEAYYRSGIAEGKVLLGVTVDFLPQRFFRDVQFADGSSLRFEVPIRSIPVMASAAYLTRLGPLDVQAFAGVGVAFVSATRGEFSGSAVLPGFLVGAGPTFAVGPGRLKVSARFQSSYGAVPPAADDPDRTPIMTAGWVGGVGGTVGYQLEF